MPTRRQIATAFLLPVPYLVVIPLILWIILVRPFSQTWPAWRSIRQHHSKYSGLLDDHTLPGWMLADMVIGIRATLQQLWKWPYIWMIAMKAR